MLSPRFCARERRDVEVVVSAADAGAEGVLLALNSIENDTNIKTTKARTKRCFIIPFQFIGDTDEAIGLWEIGNWAFIFSISHFLFPKPRVYLYQAFSNLV
jgi:hypothetical protein